MTRATGMTTVAATAVLLMAGAAWMTFRPGASPTRHDDREAREVTDMTQRQVRIPLRPQRILSLCTSATDTLIALGAADRLIAIDEFGRVVPGTDRAAVVGKGTAVSREQLVSLGVDLALLWWYQDDAAAMCDDLGIPAVRIGSGRAAELPAVIRLVGDCVDCRGEAERLAADVEAFVRQPRPAADRRPRVFLEQYGPYKTVGRDTYTNDVLELAGAENVAAGTRGSVLFSAERLVAADPDIILHLGTAADGAALAARPGMANLRAVREGRVLAIDRYWLVAGPRLPQAVEMLRVKLKENVATVL